MNNFINIKDNSKYSSLKTAISKISNASSMKTKIIYIKVK